MIEVINEMVLIGEGGGRRRFVEKVEKVEKKFIRRRLALPQLPFLPNRVKKFLSN